MTPAEVEALINLDITTNGSNSITGAILNNVLQNILGVQTKQRIIVGTSGIGGVSISTINYANDSIEGTFFSNTISEIVTTGQNYILGEDFTQAGTLITFINGGSWSNGQVLIAKL